MKILNRIFFKYYRFYTRIENDDWMVFFYTCFAISFILSFYGLMMMALIYIGTDIKLIATSGKPLTIFTFSVIGVSMFFLFKNKKTLLEMVNKKEIEYKEIDIVVWLYTIFGIVSLILSGLILSI